MTHEDARTLLLDLAYGELPPERARDVERHVDECQECGVELERIASVRRVAARLDAGPGPAASRAALVEAARRAVATQPARRWWVRRPALSFAAAAAVIAIVAGVTLELTDERVTRSVDEEMSRDVARPERTTPPRSVPTVRPERSEAESKGGQAPSPAPPRPVAPPERAAPPPPERAAPRRETAAPAIAAPPPAVTPAGPLARPAPAAPERRAATAPARKMAVPPGADAAAARAEATASDAVAPERDAAAAPLRQERHLVRCGAAEVERVALVTPAGRIIKLTERRGQTVREVWYDDAGRARLPEPRAGAAAGAGDAEGALPRIAPSLEAVATSCTW